MTPLDKIVIFFFLGSWIATFLYGFVQYTKKQKGFNVVGWFIVLIVAGVVCHALISTWED